MTDSVTYLFGILSLVMVLTTIWCLSKKPGGSSTVPILTLNQEGPSAIPKVELSDVQTGVNSTQTINANNQLIRDGFDNTLSRDGSSPNQMNAVLDMNGFRVINLPSPQGDSDPIRQIDLKNAVFATGHGTGSNSVARPEDFGVVSPGVDCSSLIGSAFLAADVVLLNSLVTYSIASPISIPTGKRLTGTGTVAAVAGGTLDHLLSMSSRAIVDSVTLDGTNLKHQTADWLGVGSPTGAAIWADTVDDWVLSGMVIQNTPNGALFARSCNRSWVDHVTLINIQTDGTFVQSAGFEYYQSNDNSLVDCNINGYGHKGFNINGSRNKVTRGHCFGSGQDAGHAAFYEDGAIDTTWMNCNHEGPGFAFKAHNATRSTVQRFTANGSAGGVYFQSAVDSKVVDANFIMADTSNQCIIIESIGGLPATNNILLDNLNLSRPSQGSTINHIGIKFIGTAALAVTNVTIRDTVISNMFYDIWTANTSGVLFKNLVFDNVTTTGSKNGWLLYPESCLLRDCHIDRASNNPTLLVYSATGTTSSTWVFLDNIFRGFSGTDEAVHIGYDLSNNFSTQLETFIFRGNRIDGANIPFRLDISNSAGGVGTNYLHAMDFESNTFTNSAAADSCLLTFSTATLTRVNISKNIIIDSSHNPKNILLTNPGSGAGTTAGISGGIIDINDVNAVTGRPNNVYPLTGTTPPASGGWPGGTIFTYTNTVKGLPPFAVNIQNGSANFHSITTLPIYNLATVDPASIAAGSQSTIGTIAATNAALGDIVDITFSNDLQGMTLHGWVSSAGIVSYVFKNGTAGAIDLASGTLSVNVRKVIV